MVIRVRLYAQSEILNTGTNLVFRELAVIECTRVMTNGQSVPMRPSTPRYIRKVSSH